MDFRMQECLPRKYARDMPESPPPWRSLETNILEVKVQPLWSAQEVLGQRGATLFLARQFLSKAAP